jgi:subtilisin family serine protease
MLTRAARATRGGAGARWWLRMACLPAALAVGVVLAAAPADADIVRSQQMWVLNAIHAPAAWEQTRGAGVTVAVIDSGVNPAVSDLAGSVVTGPNLSGVRTPASDPAWGVHGTWMASLIAGHGHAGGSAGIMGVAPQARLLSIRVVTDQGDPQFQRYEREPSSRVQRALAKAIHYATARHVSVISMSLGYGAASRPVRSAIQQALSRGAVVVASSGNSGEAPGPRHRKPAPYSFPADYPGVLGVGAVSQGGAPAGFSSDNLSVEVAAPGVKVPAQGRDGQYWLVSGTSPACALAAGAAALIKARYPRMAPALVVQAITGSTTNRPRRGYDDEVGFGTVDAAAALTLAGRLAREAGKRSGVATAVHFGGGPAAVPPVPVPPRSRRQLVLYLLLALASLAVLVAVVRWRLVAARRTHPAPERPW